MIINSCLRNTLRANEWKEMDEFRFLFISQDSTPGTCNWK